MNQTIIYIYIHTFSVSIQEREKKKENEPCQRDREHREGDPLEKLEEVVY